MALSIMSTALTPSAPAMPCTAYSTKNSGPPSSFDAEAGYQQPHAFNGGLLWGAAFARRPVRLCNGETIDANSRRWMSTMLFQDTAPASASMRLQRRKCLKKSYGRRFVVGADGGQAVGYFLSVPGRRFSGGRMD